MNFGCDSNLLFIAGDGARIQLPSEMLSMIITRFVVILCCEFSIVVCVCAAPLRAYTRTTNTTEQKHTQREKMAERAPYEHRICAYKIQRRIPTAKLVQCIYVVVNVFVY